ncbi:bifunctional diguanylate cyclase/phosphodiesterase [Marinospirillum sp.]|uniref:putative bifunctional diguanylate cyclase/phosphodiesterase n=1 Tax=Marinospirillum sp. TaxID=2183934 RepID=UPI00286FAF0F|nr:bifunctional diguanylate cyclase/phosphodiesterase [Marinospirillum sp.]MDR9468743.1 bifunctional diguanylate cyclase/phosphodiesterase [Marinospirillum sp.]
MNNRHLQDPLTGMGNRQSLMAALQVRLDAIRHSDQQAALLLVDGGRLKKINDAQGMAVGDQVILQIAQRLQGFAGSSWVVARLHADTFACFLENPGSTEDALDQAKVLLEFLAAPVVADAESVPLCPRMGMAFYPRDAATPADLLQAAEYALQGAKKSFLTPCQQFDFSQYEVQKRHLKIEKALYELMDQGVVRQLELYYQPKICLQNRCVVSSEALLRWQHPQLGSISPAEFIPLVEGTSLGVRLDRWVLSQVSEQLACWVRQGVSFPQVAVNLSTAQLTQEDFPEWLAARMQYLNLPPACLQLEITEGAMISNDQMAFDLLHRLQHLGFSLALDDFGTGYSSLSYLSKLPLDELKIDRSFIMQIAHCGRSLKLLESIVALARNLELELVIEGVETAEQLELLQPLGAMKIQGYYFYRPMKASDFTGLLSDSTSLMFF